MVSKGTIWHRAVVAILILAIVGSLAALVYVAVYAEPPEKFTEFYILGLSGKAVDYPEELGLGEEGSVIVGVINRELEPITYRVEVAINAVVDSEVGPITLAHGEQWQDTVSFVPDRVGARQKVEFLLYRHDQDNVYRQLRLWVDVVAEELEP